VTALGQPQCLGKVLHQFALQIGEALPRARDAFGLRLELSLVLGFQRQK
jgi:hypothetical protein